ncbi:glyoxalase [Caulobacter radicis]|uniref:VOC family protein n=1 Tax=Caulobacter radicis TaxID=2172650 RepID=UPI000D567DCF|nr:VOC family protein [Caulobacter radicis]PVM93074.1 glyoxalase [Caulobacter radicis]
MAKVLGLGGVFFKADDPKGLAAWYARVLGIKVEDWGGAMFSHPKVGMTNWSPFPADTRYFEPSTAPFMINLIVDDIDGVLAKAAAEGVEPTGRQDEEYGRFAWLVDPAGFKVELWQPAAEG